MQIIPDPTGSGLSTRHLSNGRDLKLVADLHYDICSTAGIVKCSRSRSALHVFYHQNELIFTRWTCQFINFYMYSLVTMKIPSPFLIPGTCSTFGWLNFIPDCNQGLESEIIDAKEGTRKKKNRILRLRVHRTGIKISKDIIGKQKGGCVLVPDLESERHPLVALQLGALLVTLQLLVLPH